MASFVSIDEQLHKSDAAIFPMQDMLPLFSDLFIIENLVSSIVGNTVYKNGKPCFLSTFTLSQIR